MTATLAMTGTLVWQDLHQPVSLSHDFLLAGSLVGLLICSIVSLKAFRSTSRKTLNSPKIRVDSMFFENQTVRLDGHEYANCHFSNVTFIYDGKQGFAFDHPRFCGRISVSSQGEEILSLLSLLKEIEEKQLPLEMVVPGQPD